MSSIEPEIREKMMHLLQEEENKTDLINLAVLSRVGMKVASSTSSELDADATSASSTALIDLGLRLSEATNHGGLNEMLLHSTGGYSILMTISDEYIVFSGLRNSYRIGYYLGYLKEMAKKLRILISGEELTETAMKLEESQLEQIKKAQELEEAESVKVVLPSVEQDKEALGDLLNFLDDWEQEGVEASTIVSQSSDNIVGIPASMSVGIPEPGGTVGIPASMSVGIPEPGGTVGIPASMSVGIPEDDTELPAFDDLELDTEIGLPDQDITPTGDAASDFKVYPDEIAPLPLDDYTPMEVEEEITKEVSEESPYVYESLDETTPDELPSLDELPSFDELDIPDFDSKFDGSEYDTSFILEEEGEALDSVLKDLGWDDED